MKMTGMVLHLSKLVGTNRACDVIQLNKSSYYRSLKPKKVEKGKQSKKEKNFRAYSDAEKKEILIVLNSQENCDKAPAQIYAKYLDLGRYLCSIRSMYRFLKEKNQVNERRKQKTHTKYKKPELIATKPNELWSWDITKLKGPEKWTYFYLYVIIDVFSRYVVGWMVATRELASLAKSFISETCMKYNIPEEQLTLHADRGPSMKSQVVGNLLADLGVTKTHSRPYVSNDNPYSESQFKTMKYRPEFPERFGCIQDSRVFLVDFFSWYNFEHYHSGINLLTANNVHFENPDYILEKRFNVVNNAFENNPEKFISGKPKLQKLAKEVWINKPKNKNKEEKNGIIVT